MLSAMNQSARLPPYGQLPACTFAFQPILDAHTRTVVAYEALVRGAQGESAGSVIAGIATDYLPRFDEQCRCSAMQLAARLGMTCDLNLNLIPQGFQADRDCLASTLDAAIAFDFSPERLVVEITEGEVLGDQARFTDLMEVYRGLGMRLSLDNFGSVYAGLNLLAAFRPDQLKLDRSLSREIQHRPPQQALVRGIVQVCNDLQIQLIAEGVETADEYRWLCDAQLRYFQGFLFGRPGFELLPPLQLPEELRSQAA